MKLLLVGLFVSFSALATGPVLIDAACKTTCIVSSAQTAGISGYITTFEYADVYTDYKGLTREQLDQKSQKTAIDAVCKTAFSEKARASESDCLKFKAN